MKSKKLEPPTHYQVLGVPPSIEASKLHDHYKELALLHHPDKCPNLEEALQATERFARITEAYSVLRAPKLRVAYDAQLKVLGLCCPECGGQGTRLITVKNFRRGAYPVNGVCSECSGTGRNADR